MMPVMRKVHTYLGLFAAVIVIIIAVTGILLVHRKSLGLDTVTLRAPGYSVLQAAPDAWDLLPLESGDVVVATKQGVFVRSGAAWRLALSQQARRLYRRDSVVYACAKKGLFASVDGGMTWTEVFRGEEVKALRFQGEQLFIYAEGHVPIAGGRPPDMGAGCRLCSEDAGRAGFPI